MFKCDSCGVTSQPREPQTTRVVKTRHKEYLYPHYGEGTETVKEIHVCSNCDDTMTLASVRSDLEMDKAYAVLGMDAYVRPTPKTSAQNKE